MINALQIAAQAAEDFLETLDSQPVAATVGAATLRARFGSQLESQGLPADRVIRELLEAVDGGVVRSAGGRFFAWVVGGGLSSALAADWLTSTWDTNAALFASGPAASIVEEIAGAWLKDILGLPERASFAFVSGCQLAHVTCLAAARHALLARRGWNVEEQGLWSAPPIRILSSDQHHGSIERAVRFLGIGTSQIIHLPTNERGQLRADVLEETLAMDRDVPAIVLLQAGEINTGSFDSFETLIPIAKRFNAWVHVDGAFGLWAAASPRFRHLVRGVEQADSWSTDAHKWLNVPFDSGLAFIADPESHRAAMSHRASYLTHAADSRDQMDWTPEWSRRARGFPVYAALRELGRYGVADLVDRCSRFCHALTTGIGRLPGAELLWEPMINQGLVRFLDPAGQDHDRRTDEVIAAIAASGEAFFSGTTWRGRRAMRISVVNWRTTEQDVQRTIACVEKILKGENHVEF